MGRAEWDPIHSIDSGRTNVENKVLAATISDLSLTATIEDLLNPSQA